MSEVEIELDDDYPYYPHITMTREELEENPWGLTYVKMLNNGVPRDDADKFDREMANTHYSFWEMVAIIGKWVKVEM